MSNIWALCKEVLRTKVNDSIMETWFEPIVCEEVLEERIVLSVPNPFFVSWIKDNYLDLLSETLTQIARKEYNVLVTSRNESLQDFITEARSEDTPIHNEHIDFEEIAAKYRLNSRYTFDSFVVGGCNQFAHAAALSIVDNLGKSYNPFFIYGGVGLGKTHLMTSIGFSVITNDRNKKIVFSTSEEFTNEVIKAIRFDGMAEFRNKYRNVDLLMIDDIQFIAGKERTQEEFFHTFESLHKAGKQIILTSDQFPNEISDMEHRLRSRFSWGLVADMGIPDLETRVAILKRKASEDKVELPDDVAYFLAGLEESNIRVLLGYLVRVIAMRSFHGIPLTKQSAQSALGDLINRNTKTITVEDIISQVSKAFNVKTADVKSRKKQKLFTLPRQVAMYLTREMTDMSFPGIGAAFGGKNYSTVIHAVKTIEEKMKQDHTMKNLVETLRKNIRE